MSAIPESRIHAVVRPNPRSILLDYESVKKERLFDQVLDSSDIIVKMGASSVNHIELNLDRTPMSNKRVPYVQGLDFSGEVIAVGYKVQNVKVGDRVFGVCDFMPKNGTWAEYATVPSHCCVKIPENIDMKAAGTVGLCALTSLQAIKDLKLKRGDKILIMGGGTSTGMYAISIAKKMGLEVIVTCSPKSFELVERLGADIVINYQEETFYNTTKYDKVDGIYDTYGFPSGFDKCHERLVDGGKYVSIGEFSHDVYGWQSMFTGIRMRYINAKRDMLSLFGHKHSYRFLMMKPNQRDLKEIQVMLRNEEITPVIDSYVPLSGDVFAATSKVIESRAKGKICIVINEDME
eukprot:TRINITY_DN8714_c0_g1_i1.p1 TRINITY_DN8714_c0_g1~~TRINITY_DN8714_c0_g1_i1.p1  ORF type:complete len:349 (+),score=95.30 TRINITY_DN8714_c0_g1_i1:110-1156(+)